MAIVKTIGSGGDYADIGLAYQYLHSLGALSDDRMFTIISDFTENTGIPIELGNADGINYNGKTVSYVNPNKYIITIPASSKFLYFKATSSCVVTDLLTIDGLIFKLLSSSTAGDVLSSRSHYGDVGITNNFKNITIIGAGYIGSGIVGIMMRYGQGIDRILNCRITGVDTGIGFIDGTFTTIGDRHYIENCAIVRCSIGVDLPVTTTIVNITCKNVVCSDCATDFASGGVHNIVTNCADSDNSIASSGAILTDNITGIVDGDFLSVDPTSADFLLINNLSSLFNKGTTSISVWNTTDINGINRPNQGRVSIGVNEPEAPTTTTTTTTEAPTTTTTTEAPITTTTVSPTTTTTTTPAPEPVVASSIVADYLVSIKEGYSPLTVVFTENCIGDPTYFRWYFGDGTSVVGEENPEHTYTKSGIYSPVLEIRKDDDFDVIIKTNYIIINRQSSGSENTIIESYQNDSVKDWKFYIDSNLFLIFNKGGEIYKSGSPVIKDGVWTLVEFHPGRNQFYVSTVEDGRKKIATYDISAGVTGMHTENKLLVTPNSSMKIDELRAVRKDEDLNDYFRSLKKSAYYLQ
jgi:PKD repeat protein